MGLLDQVIGGVVGQVLGGGRGGALSSPIVKALLMLLLAKGASGGGLGDILGRLGGQEGGGHEGRPPMPDPGADDGDLGGFGQGRRSGPPVQRQGDSDLGGEFGDLAGMLDGPGVGGDRAPGAGPYARLDRDEADAAGQEAAGGLGGLIQSFERSGLGDVIGSWIGHGPNQQVAPNRLAEALGPDTVDSLSRETGLSRDDLLGQLAQALPGVIDALTPQGRPPSREDARGW
ncbi:YidB family protein [Methylorubrum sp. SB2]|uniref:YidB family protein n=1 Tax=Methylorubrum subtropicum TaxID=3138812 RepID=UPI00313C77F4